MILYWALLRAPKISLRPDGSIKQVEEALQHWRRNNAAVFNPDQFRV